MTIRPATIRGERGLFVDGVFRSPTFAAGPAGIDVLKPERVTEYANACYAGRSLTDDERRTVRVMRQIHAPAHIAGLDVQGINARPFCP